MNRVPKRRLLAGIIALSLLFAGVGQAVIVEKLSLDALVDRAGVVFRGELMRMEPSSVQVGGGELPVVEYTFNVSDYIKGGATGAKAAELTVRMIGDLKTASNATIQRVSALPKMPELQVGGDYVLFVSQPSAVGLSAPIGLAQGAFTLSATQGGGAMASNGLGNRGLFDGAVSYAELKAAVLAELD